MNICLEAKSVDVNCEIGFKLLACSLDQENDIKFLLASSKTLTNYNKISAIRIKLLFRLSFALIG
jgi:hypothetical protein